MNEVKILNDLMLESVIVEGKPALVAIVSAFSIPCDHFKHEFEGVQVPMAKYQICADENPSAIQRLHASELPVTLFLKDGQEFARWAGPYSREALQERVLERMKKA